MGWGGFLAGVAEGAGKLADRYITEEMQMIREMRVEESRIRQEDREFARESSMYERKRADTLEDYKAKKDIDLQYRDAAGIGRGGGGEKFQVMTMEDGTQRLVTRRDLEQMHKEGRPLGFKEEGSETFKKGYLGGSPQKMKGSASQADRYDDAARFVNALDDRHGEEIPDHLRPSYDNALAILSEGLGQQRQPAQSASKPGSGGFLSRSGDRSMTLDDGTQVSGMVSMDEQIGTPKAGMTGNGPQPPKRAAPSQLVGLSKEQAAALFKQGYRVEKNPVTGEYRATKQ